MKENCIVFTQAYNAEKTLERAIESIFNQTRTDWKYFILDNGSNDDTYKIMQKYAKADDRIVPLRIGINNIANGATFHNAILHSSQAQYTFWLDADDEYMPSFYEKSSRFMDEENLDIVMCGYECVDAKSGKLLKSRAYGEKMVITPETLVRDFTAYRGYTVSAWSKLYKINFLTKKQLSTNQVSFTTYDDTRHGLFNVMKKISRAGILGEPLYRYYQYSYSAKHYGDEKNLFGAFNLFESTIDYLDLIQNTDDNNTDYCFAIGLDAIQGMISEILRGITENTCKPSIILIALNHYLVHETFSRKCNPEYIILAKRGDYLKDLTEKINQIKFSDNKEKIKILKKLDMLSQKLVRAEKGCQ